MGVVLLAAGLWKARDQVIGDLGRGVPELRADSRYNRDVDVISKSFAIGVDVLQVIAAGRQSARRACDASRCSTRIDRFEFLMRQTEGVQSVRGPRRLHEARRRRLQRGRREVGGDPGHARAAQPVGDVLDARAAATS